MKKLALALVCLVSVAFFASCQKPIENPEPTIAFMAGDDCISTDAEISTGETAWFDIKAAANTQTNKLLKSFYFQVYVGDERIDDTLFSDINQASFDYFIGYEFEDAGVYTISATVTDADGYSAQCQLDLTVFVSDSPLLTRTFTWNRHGGADATGLEEFGLKWTSNGKEDFARITPLNGVTMFEFDPEVWDNVNTANELTALFNTAIESGSAITLFNKVSAWASHEYNYVIGTIMQDGKFNLMHVTNGVVSTFKGTDITITGEAKNS